MFKNINQFLESCLYLYLYCKVALFDLKIDPNQLTFSDQCCSIFISWLPSYLHSKELKYYYNTLVQSTGYTVKKKNWITNVHGHLNAFSSLPVSMIMQSLKRTCQTKEVDMIDQKQMQMGHSTKFPPSTAVLKYMS